MLATSYNGWAASPDRHAIGVVPLTVAGVPIVGGVRKGDVWTVLEHAVEQWHRRVEHLHPGWCWGFAYRQNRNADNLSCHASGTAVDLNAPAHPNGKRGTFTRRQIVEIRKILAELEGVVRWGGDFTGTVDAMHLEIRGDAAAVARVARRLRSHPPAVKPAPVKPPARRPSPPPAVAPRGVMRMIVRFAGKPEVYEVVGSHLEHVTLAAFEARGRPAVLDLPASHPLAMLPKLTAAQAIG